MKKKVSVIIPTHKGAPIKNSIESIKQSTYKNIEIIIVDEGLERSAQRNIGIHRATGNYFLFLDSDQMVSQKLIEECIEIFKWAHYRAIFIPEIIIDNTFFGEVRSFERLFYTGTYIDVPRFIRKNDCPLFDENLHGPEDSDWDRRIAGSKTISKHCVYHCDKVNILTYFKKKAYYAKSMQKFREKWPNDKVLQFKYRCWTVFTENEKWKRLFRYPGLAFVMVVMIFIRGIIYLWNIKEF